MTTQYSDLYVHTLGWCSWTWIIVALVRFSKSWPFNCHFVLQWLSFILASFLFVCRSRLTLYETITKQPDSRKQIFVFQLKLTLRYLVKSELLRKKRDTISIYLACLCNMLWDFQQIVCLIIHEVICKRWCLHSRKITIT